MYVLGYVAILLALLAAVGCGSLALLQLWEGRDSLSGKMEIGAWIIAICLLLASALLLHGLFWQDYRLEYVATYTDSYLPAFYRLTAFWAGQPGSMLFWALATAISGWIFLFSLRRQSCQIRLWYWVFFYLIMAFFCLVLSSWSNPFIMLEPAPADGNGLNPLLQNPGMIIHPPLLFMGYAGLTIPACLAIAQLLGGPPSDAPWYQATRNYYLVSWLLLSAGIILGGWWAYMELGWGGYWAWDPVENASLLPWLIATAAIHIIAVTRKSGKLKRTGAALMISSVILAFFATYLTRSGVIQSVHAFGDGGVGTPLIIFVMGGFFLLCLASWTKPASSRPLGDILSREGAAVLACWLFAALTIIIATATMWPVISQIWGQGAKGLDASFYNRVCLPLLSMLLLLLLICPALNWQGGVANKGLAYLAAFIFAAALIIIWWSGYTRPLPLFSAALACGIGAGSVCSLLQKQSWKQPRHMAALFAHAGVALMAFGIAFSGPYTVERELLLAKSQTENAGPYAITLLDVKEGHGAGYDFLQASLKITQDNREIGVLQPERRIYEKFGDMQFSEVDVLTGLGKDIYASLLGMDEELRVLVRISLEPLINWIWIGGLVMCLLPLIGLWKPLGAQKEFMRNE